MKSTISTKQLKALDIKLSRLSMGAVFLAVIEIRLKLVQ